jgi:threonylcarbamoyladenosine tRNA methylthiotransferase MtaB
MRASRIQFDGMQFRHDIGRRALQMKLTRHHFRLPRQPGGLLGFEKTCHSWCSRGRAGAGRTCHREYVFGNRDGRSGRQADDSRVARENPTARIVVTGCYATRRPEVLQSLPNVVRVVSNDDKPLMVSFISPNERMTTASRFGEGDGSCGAAVVPGVAGRTAFTLRVQTGCAETCSYCIIPSTRGGPRSSSVDAVLAEIARVTHAGFKEIALTGVHLGSYGRDLVPSSSLVELLRAVRLQPDVLFRISSLEPMDCSGNRRSGLGRQMLRAPLHLPLQHASIVSPRAPATHRATSARRRHRNRMPHASIGSTSSSGFPVRITDFEQLASPAASPLTHVHVFPGRHPGTDATR